MKNKYLLGVVALTMIAVLGVSLVVAFPAGNGFGLGKTTMSAEEQTAMQAQMQAVQTAVENGDFATWKSLMEAQLTEESFNKLVEANKEMSEMKTLQDELTQAVEDGDTAKAAELKAQLYDLMPERGFKGGEMHAPMEKPESQTE
jgi:hypothetical protein